MIKFFDDLLRDKKKNCIAKQHYINIGGFATQMEAYRLAEKLVNIWEYLKSTFLLMKDIWKSLKQIMELRHKITPFYAFIIARIWRRRGGKAVEGR